jgi:peroxiredoxin Q/BCP
MPLTLGKKAPAFALTGDEGKTIKLSDYVGHPLVIFFYPKDLTPGCTQEACDFRDSLTRLKKMGGAVIGVSKDGIKSHQKFRDAHSLNFPLLSDESGAMCEAYGVWKEKSMYGKKYWGIERTTVVLDSEGKVQRVFEKVKVKGHVEEVLEAVSSLT